MSEKQSEKITCNTLLNGKVIISSKTIEELKESYERGEIRIVLLPKKKIKDE